MEPKEDPKYVEFKETVIRYAIDHKLYTGDEHDYVPVETMLNDGSIKDRQHVLGLYEHCVNAYGHDKATSCPRFRIRKLTPREAFRLMDVDDKDIDKIQAYRWEDNDYERDCQGNEVINVETGKRQKHKMGQPISNSASYKLAGNSIVTSCLYHIFKNLFIEPTYAKSAPQDCKMDGNGQLELF